MLSIAIMILPVPDGPIGKLLSSRRPRSRLNLLFSKLCVRRQVVSSTWILLPLPNVPAPPCRFQIQIIYLVSKIVKKMMAFLVSVKLLVNLQAALVTRMLACWFLFRILVCLWFVRRMVLSQFPSASRFFNPWAFNCVFILCPMCQMESISYTMKTTCTSLPWSYGKALSKRLMMQLLFRSPCLPWPSCSAMPTSLSTSAALPSPCQTPKRMSLVVLGCCPRMYTRLMFSLVIVATALSPQGMIFQHWCIVWVGSVPLLWEPCVAMATSVAPPSDQTSSSKMGRKSIQQALMILVMCSSSTWENRLRFGLLEVPHSPGVSSLCPRPSESESNAFAMAMGMPLCIGLLWMSFPPWICTRRLFSAQSFLRRPCRLTTLISTILSFPHRHRKGQRYMKKILITHQGPCEVWKHHPASRSPLEQWEIQTICSWLVHSGQSQRSSGPWCHLHGKDREQSSCAQVFAQDTFKVQELGWLRHGPCVGRCSICQNRSSFQTDQILGCGSFSCFEAQKTCKYNPLHILSKANHDDEIAQYSAWRHYRKIMEDGGIKKDISVAQAVKAFKVTWLHFARHKSVKEQDMVQQQPTAQQIVVLQHCLQG